MSIELIRGELERLYSLEEMQSLSSELLGFEPTAVGGTASPASFARALTEHCQQNDAIAALIDAVHGTRADASPKLARFVEDVLRAPVELKAGDGLGPYTITRKIGAGPNGTVYQAKRGETSSVLKLLHNAAVHDKTALYRYLTRARLLSRETHPNLAAGQHAGLLEGKAYTAYDFVDARPLAARIGRTGPLHINEARPILHGVLEALRAIHARKLTHGAIKLENVLVAKHDDGSPRILLVDAGGDLLISSWVHSDVATTGGNRIKGMAPEQLKGLGTTAKSDLYAFGALLFEVLAGRPPLEERTATDLAVAHLSKQPQKAVDLAPRGWVSKELSELCERLLDKTPGKRPDIDEILALVGPLEKPKEAISEEEVAQLIDTLVADPTDGEAAIALELTLERKADARKVAEAFLMAADQVDAEAASTEARKGEESAAIAEAKAEAARDRAIAVKRGLLLRAGRLFETQLKDHARAEEAYGWLVEIAPQDEVAATGYEQALRAQSKLDELVEHLLARSEKSDNHSERARALNKIGHLYAGPLDDQEQAVFAFAQALAQDVENQEFADDLERAAADKGNLWAEAMRTLHEVTDHPRMPTETRVTLFLRLARWYDAKLKRPDLALPCYERVLQLDPAHDPALAGMSEVYRRAQQWNELVTVLLARAERAPTPARARDLRAEAADILDTRLSEAGRARDLYEEILTEDPGHTKTVEALARIYSRANDHAGYAKILGRQAEAQTGSARAETLCKLGELAEDQLNDLADAERHYQAALAIDPALMAAIRGLDRIFNRTGRYGELLENLARQVTLAATPRQRINLYERIAGIHDEEFLDHDKATAALEKVLELDGSHEGAMTALMRHYRALDRWDEVNDLYDRMLRVTTDEKRRVELLLAQGRVLLEQIGSPERARLAYENVLYIEPGNAQALQTLTQLRAATGDAMAALKAVESLAEKTDDGEQRAELWIRAAKILEEHGDRDGAIARYKLALDAQATSSAATTGLRAAYLARGDAQSAADLVDWEIRHTDGKLAKARLYCELAELRRDKLGDRAAAREAASRALDFDPMNVGALLIMGDLAFEAGSFLETATHFGQLATRVELLDKSHAKRMLIRYIDALGRSGSTEKAKTTVNALLELAPDDPEALLRAARVRLDAGDGAAAADLYARVRTHDEALSAEQRLETLLGHGKALRAAGRAAEGVAALEEAADLSPDSVDPIHELALSYEALSKWEDLVRVKQRRLDLVQGDERVTLLLEIGEILATHVKDATRAAKTLMAALDERPDDRRVLTRLMKLYSEEKDWQKLVDVVLKLAEGVEDKKQKAKYVHTAAVVSAKQVGDLDRAIEYFDQVMQLDPDSEKALLESIEIRAQKGDHEGLVEYLNIALERAEKAGDRERQVELLERLATAYDEHLDRLEEAILALERAHRLDPDKVSRIERLADLYGRDLDVFLDKAVAMRLELVRKNPFDAQGVRALRKIFTEAREADAAWCVCQALHVMSSAEPDEERFFKRMRPDTAAEAKERVSDDDWANVLTHPSVDGLLTGIFQMIEPAVLAKNAQPLEMLGYQPAFAIDLSMHPYPMSQTLYYAGGVLGMELPYTFQNARDPGGISFLHARPPAIVLGSAALAAELPTQAAAFIAARHLTYYRSGMYIRHLVPTGTGLRAWLFAAIRLIHEAFPVAAELETTVTENLAAIRPFVQGPAREQLASVVAKVLQSGAIDLKRWVSGVDLSSDRAGFLVCHDLEIACEMIKASDEASATVSQRDRIKELTLFSIDPSYSKLRKRLGINIDA
jgi:tetratricopeptide (TPR) repeat protein